MKLFVVSESICGEAKTSFFQSTNILHVKKYLLLNYHPNSYYCTFFDLHQSKENALLSAVLMARESVKKDRYGMEYGWNSLDKPHENNIDKLSKFFDSSFLDVISQLQKSDIDNLFKFAFTGGFGEQCGIPGKEWHTISITEFDMDSIQIIKPLKK